MAKKVIKEDPAEVVVTPPAAETPAEETPNPETETNPEKGEEKAETETPAEEPAEATVPDNVTRLLKLYSDEAKLYVDAKGGVFTENTPAHIRKDAVLYENPYFNK